MKEFLGSVAAILAIVGTAPYLLDTITHKTKPHMFTWIIWSIATVLVFVGQWQKGAGPGSWTTGITAILSLCITFFAIKNGTKDITTSDKVLFIGSLFAIGLWILTKDPTLSVIMLTCIDVSAFIPTIRKSITHPGDETFVTYFVNIFRHSLSLAALKNYNLVTYLFPLALVVMNIIMVGVLLFPRKTKS